MTLQKQLANLVDDVPRNAAQGAQSGLEVEWFVKWRDDLEDNLIMLGRVERDTRVQLCSLQAQEPDILQTITVPLHEVRANPQDWIPAFQYEYNVLVHDTQAVQPMAREALPEGTELIPGKMVCVRKGGSGQHRARAVICGNMASPTADPSWGPAGSYASGADGTLIRCAVRQAAHEGWRLSALDVKSAFLQAPRPVAPGANPVAVVPPRLMSQLGICPDNEVWVVKKALYGFQTSPSHWAVHRDERFSTFEWTSEGMKFKLQPTKERNLWRIVKEGDKKPVGLMLVYVDDLLVMGTSLAHDGLVGRIQEEWKTSKPEKVNTEEWVRFCGFEMKFQGDNILVGQPSYLQDLLRRRGITTKRSTPLPKEHLAALEVEEEIKIEDVRQAQAIAGEILWMSVRSRPDLAYAIGALGREVTKHPRWAVQTGHYILEYLNATAECFLSYGRCRDKDRGPDDALARERSMDLVEIYCDVSYAPQGEKSVQGIVAMIGGGVVQWESSRQSCMALSTAEAELLAYIESSVMGDSLQALLGEVLGLGELPSVVTYGDSQAAIAIIQQPDGPWRTRHLRLRSYALRERARLGTWQIYHMEGSKLIADFLTKAIAVKSSWQRFRTFINMIDMGENDQAPNDDSMVGENDGGVRLAKVALCMASCAACHQWPNAVTKAAVVASLAVALAFEATCLFNKRRSGPGDSKPLKPQGQQISFSEKGESKGSVRPRLCALRGGSSAREPKDQGSQQEESRKEKENKSEQEARESVASGRTQGSEEVPLGGPADPDSSLEASCVELETSSVRHGIWGKIQLRFSGGGRESRNLGYQEGGTSASSSSGTRTWEVYEGATGSPPVKAPPVIPEEIQVGQQPMAKSPPILPKYVQHVPDINANNRSGGENSLWKSPPAQLFEGQGGKAAARGAAAMGTSSKSMSTAKGYGGSPSRPTSLASAWPDEAPPWIQTPKHMAMPRPPVEPGEDPHRGYENPWERPHWPQVPRLIPPYGVEDDQLTLQPSVWWTQILFDKVQLLIDEEATKFRPVPRTDAWDYLRLPSATWLTRRHSLRVQRFHPEHRSTPENLRSLEYLRVTVAWVLNLSTMKFGNRLIFVDSDWRKDGLPNTQGRWCGFSFFLVKDQVAIVP